MASLTLKDIPMELHGQLKNEAAANFRSLTQEAMSRLERTFQIDAALTTYKAAQEAKRAKVVAAQENLRKALNKKQEAQATLLRLLD